MPMRWLYSLTIFFKRYQNALTFISRWYRAPECLLTDGYYGPEMDLWGAGCVFFEITSLYPLFPGTNEIDQVSRIHKVEPSKLHGEWTCYAFQIRGRHLKKKTTFKGSRNSRPGDPFQIQSSWSSSRQFRLPVSKGYRHNPTCPSCLPGLRGSHDEGKIIKGFWSLKWMHPAQ